jgi:hypothetical protein
MSQKPLMDAGFDVIGVVRGGGAIAHTKEVMLAMTG